MGTHDFKYNKVPLFARKTRNINNSMFDVPKLALVQTSHFLLRCNLVIQQCMCQVLLRLKEVQMGTHDFKCNKVAPILLENQGISILRCLLPQKQLLCQQAVITAM